MPLRRARAENSFAAFDKGFNMRRSLVVVFVCLFFALAAHAGSIPTYTITQGSAVISINPFDLDPDIFFQFSGSGFSVTGSGGISSNFGIIGAPPGFGPLDPGLSIFSDFSNDAGGFGTIGGVNYSSLFFNSFLFTSGPSFNLPSGDQFSITLPVKFFGAAGVCVPDPATLSCSSVPGNFNFNGKGTATINYVNQNGSWFFNSATFTLSPVPEPGTFVLLGSGITAMLGVVRRARRSFLTN